MPLIAVSLKEYYSLELSEIVLFWYRLAAKNQKINYQVFALRISVTGEGGEILKNLLVKIYGPPESLSCEIVSQPEKEKLCHYDDRLAVMLDDGSILRVSAGWLPSEANLSVCAGVLSSLTGISILEARVSFDKFPPDA